MTKHDQTREDTGHVQAGEETGLVRETYEEYAVGETTVSMIADPENGHAWIQSTLTQQVVE